MKKKKKNFLLDSVLKLFHSLPRGRVLDLGCGDGDYANGLAGLGFEVIAGDIDITRFKHNDKIEFKHCDITREMPFPESYFDYVVLMEVVEHLSNPYSVMERIGCIIKENGSLIISTPNVLSLKSRLRFLFEGCYEYFREPPLDQVNNPKEVVYNLHIVPYRYHELEYLLLKSGFKVEQIATSQYESYGLWFLLPIIKFQAWQKERRALKKGGIDYRRINKVLLSKELLFGRHLIIKAKKYC
ncbi:MAG: putative S-adenosylmethionine-dependent methyltransferase [Candidatus Omnitrophica bacterium ADurb.Bin205]|nr:MAG: putative S-adenosylmethionine-dependent methyltransferase [Candidatus Omnitrophica bacterium ADurb.Bin205]